MFFVNGEWGFQRIAQSHCFSHVYELQTWGNRKFGQTLHKAQKTYATIISQTDVFAFHVSLRETTLVSGLLFLSIVVAVQWVTLTKSRKFFISKYLRPEPPHVYIYMYMNMYIYIYRYTVSEDQTITEISRSILRITKDHRGMTSDPLFTGSFFPLTQNHQHNWLISRICTVHV